MNARNLRGKDLAAATKSVQTPFAHHFCPLNLEVEPTDGGSAAYVKG